MNQLNHLTLSGRALTSPPAIFQLPSRVSIPLPSIGRLTLSASPLPRRVSIRRRLTPVASASSPPPPPPSGGRKKTIASLFLFFGVGVLFICVCKYGIGCVCERGSFVLDAIGAIVAICRWGWYSPS